MAEKDIKYIDLAKELNVGVGSLRDFLKKKEILSTTIINSTKVEEKAFEAIVKEYAPKSTVEEVRENIIKNKSNRQTPTATKSQGAKGTATPQPSPEAATLVKTEKKNKKTEGADKPQTVSPNVIRRLDLDGKGTKVSKENPAGASKEIKVTVTGNLEERKAAAKAKEEAAAKIEEIVPDTKEATESSTDENGVYRPSETQQIQVNVLRRIDLSTIPTIGKKNDKGAQGKRRKRINSQAVDIKTEAAKVNENGGNNNRRGAQGQGNNQFQGNGQRRGLGNNQGQGNNSNNDANRRKKGTKTNAPVQKVEISEEDVQKQVKETLARLQGKKSNFEKKARARKDRRDAHRQAAENAFEAEERESRILKLTEFVTVSDLANMMDVPVNEVIATCMSIDMMVSINMRLDGETIKMVAEEFGFDTEFVSTDVVEAIKEVDEVDNTEDLLPRAPIVTVMGHVDHGKTSLLDNIRKTNVIAGEAGGITQHIGSYNVTLSSGRKITFLDTPGHEAFTAMRARGAKATDIAIIIIACNDSVMPQTVEAINHAAAAGVPIVFALNKIDVPGAQPEKIREQLANMNYLVEDWGGKYQCQEISAKKGIGVNELLEKVLLEADMLELKANPKRRASGLIIESSLDKGRGYVSNILVHNGTLHVGDIILAGKYYGRVKAMSNERNQSLKEAGPSVPATILGFNGAPPAGDAFNVLETEQEARDIANRRTQLEREQGLRTQKRLTLDDIGHRIAVGNFQELNLIIKGDVDGSVGVLSEALIGLSTEEIVVRTIHKGVGQISESDVVLAEASQAIIIGFQVRPSAAARKKAEQSGVEIRTYSIIYDTIADVRSAMEGMLSPEIKEQITALLEIQQTFTIGKVGTIAGCMVKEGKIHRTDKVRVIRDGIVIHTGILDSLKRFKDDVKEVAMGLDCGLNLKGFNDLIQGDIIEAYEEIEVKKKL